MQANSGRYIRPPQGFEKRKKKNLAMIYFSNVSGPISSKEKAWITRTDFIQSGH